MRVGEIILLHNSIVFRTRNPALSIDEQANERICYMRNVISHTHEFCWVVDKKASFGYVVSYM